MVTANAKKELIKPIIDSNGARIFKVYVRAPAVDNKANLAVIKLIAEDLNINQSQVSIVHGHTQKTKLIDINLLP